MNDLEYGVDWGLYNNNNRAIASYWRSLTQPGPRLRPRRVWRSIRLLRIYSVNCGFVPLWEKIRAFYYLSRENFHLWADRQKMNVVLSQKRVIRSHSNFLRSLHSWTRPPKKFFWNFYISDWEIFGVEEKNWKANILSRVIVIVATLRELLATDHLHLQYFFQIFILTVHAAMTSSILGKTRYGVISRPVPGPPSYYFLLSTMTYVWNEVGLGFLGLEILNFAKKGWGKWVYPNYNLPQFSKFSSWFFNFFKNWIRSRWMERMLQWSHIFENYTVAATRLPQTFLNSKKLHFQISIDQKQFKLGWFESW